MKGPSPYRHWQYHLRESRRREHERIRQQWHQQRSQVSWAARVRPFARTFGLLFGISATYSTLRMWAMVYGSC
ncbi:MAG: hypothetical protein IPK87_00250 [Planctomycetes bacterium]|nr:hypothetical protein [Planctomycetota bacterium]